MSIELEQQIKDIERLRKQIFHNRLTGDPITISNCDTTGRERDARRILLWQTGVLALERPTFFKENTSHRGDWAAGMYTHPIRILDYDYPGPKGKILPKGERIGISFNVYNWLISHEDTQVVDFLRGKNSGKSAK